MADPVSIIVWRDLKTDPPTGDDARQVLLLHHSGGVGVFHAYRAKTYRQPDWLAVWLAWSELHALPADPSERLTTDDVEGAATACDDVASDLFNVSLGRSGSVKTWRKRAARLRNTLPGQDGTT